MIQSYGNQPETNQKLPDFVGWLDPTRSDQIRYRIDGPGQMIYYQISMLIVSRF
jgi:hypothetical protein